MTAVEEIARADWAALFTVIVNEPVVAVAPLASVTLTVITELVICDAFPDMKPVDVSRVSPVGRDPDASAKVRGVAPPDGERTRENEVPKVVVSPEPEGVAMVSVGATDRVALFEVVVAVVPFLVLVTTTR